MIFLRTLALPHRAIILLPYSVFPSYNVRPRLHPAERETDARSSPSPHLPFLGVWIRDAVSFSSLQ